MSALPGEGPIPTYAIDLAEAPRQRYAEVARDFEPRLRALTGLFGDVIELFLPKWLGGVVQVASRFLLRRVYDDEENEEIRGIADVSGVPLHLVALNNLLDCLVGCTSGAVPVQMASKNKDRDGAPSPARLLHFRTLDWGMDGLRDLLVVLDFVDSSSRDPTRVIARSTTYVGFIGTLTAVRKGLSLSMNFRPNHDHSSRTLRLHQLLVLLGRRRSFSSVLRSLILEPDEDELDAGRDANSLQNGDIAAASRLEVMAKRLAAVHSAPRYLILCDGSEAAVIEKDHTTGRIRTSSDFIAQTNHDVEDHQRATVGSSSSSTAQALTPAAHDRVENMTVEERQEIITSSFNVEGWVEESADRLACIEKRWRRRVKHSAATQPSVTETTLRNWVTHYPTMNECTHFATIMDPTDGTTRWLERGYVYECEDSSANE